LRSTPRLAFRRSRRRLEVIALTNVVPTRVRSADRSTFHSSFRTARAVSVCCLSVLDQAAAGARSIGHRRWEFWSVKEFGTQNDYVKPLTLVPLPLA
jgi:hypothetical protein